MCMLDKDEGAGRMSGDAGVFPEHEVIHLFTLHHTADQVRCCGLGRVGIGRSSWEGLSTGRHEITPVRCPCSWLAALHGAPRTLS